MRAEALIEARHQQSTARKENVLARLIRNLAITAGERVAFGIQKPAQRALRQRPRTFREPRACDPSSRTGGDADASRL